MATDYKYSLIKGSRKLTCPHCGRPKCFKPYINNETGEILHEAVGRCDHEQSCQYHYTPHDYFADHPEARDQKSDRKKHLKSMVQIKAPAHKECQQTEFFPFRWAEIATKRECTFTRWFLSLPFSDDIKQQVLAEYYVGGTADDIWFNHVNYGKAAVFCMIDEQQRVHDAKFIAYQIDGHRVESWGNTMRAICKKTGKGPQLEETEKVLFGLHLLPKYPDKVVCIVESEKTALICACHYPKYLWLATGGCGNLQAAKLRSLMDRKLVVYPDSGEYGKWSERMKQSGHEHYAVVDFLEAYEPNTDIADIILGVAKQKEPPTAQQSTESAPVELTPLEQAWQQMKARNPALELLEKGLDLVPIESRKK